MLGSEIKVSLGVAKIANLLPQINDIVAQANTYG